MVAFLAHKDLDLGSLNFFVFLLLARLADLSRHSVDSFV